MPENTANDASGELGRKRSIGAEALKTRLTSDSKPNIFFHLR